MSDRKKMIRDLLATPAERKSTLHPGSAKAKAPLTPEQRADKTRALAMACDTMKEIFVACDTDDDAKGTIAVFDALNKHTPEDLAKLAAALIHLNAATEKLVPTVAQLIMARMMPHDEGAIDEAKAEFLADLQRTKEQKKADEN